MRPIKTFTVNPRIPDKLKDLRKIAFNLWWTWNPDAVSLFNRMDPGLWTSTHHNPVEMFGKLSQSRFDELVSDESFVSHLERVSSALDSYMVEKTWYHKTYGKVEKPMIAYFSAEYGITECLPFYSGGLGILAGDHLKSSSDIGIPLVGLGLMYQVGYFRQYLNTDGWQGESYPVNDFYNMPVTLEKGFDGNPLMIEVDYPGRKVKAQIWRIQVGRVPLFLLDTNLEENSPLDRQITNRLYGGGKEHRIKQEMLIGFGGIKALEVLDLTPRMFHMNEGHSAFLALERIRKYMKENGLSFNEAMIATKSGSLFTTHTPVPAGIDMFPTDLVDTYFSSYWINLGVSRKDFMGLGKQNPDDNLEEFSMAVLALRLSAHSNGVSRLHSKVSKQLWKNLWPQIPGDEIPIGYVSNGIHHLSWISGEIASLYDRYLGPDWKRNPQVGKIWKGLDYIPAEELWRTHERRRERLVSFVRKRLKGQLQRRGLTSSEVAKADEVLDPEALTIGFARRFATYKRGTLIFRDLERLKRIINNRDKPVQFIFAGKAHPKDQEGKKMIQEIIHIVNWDEDLKKKIVFLEDYDAEVARYMVEGVDVWLNTPRRPMEASGTSGMKASANGVLNMSVLDGWWDEIYTPDIGWAIGRGEIYDDSSYQDAVESNAMYELLEKDVVPLFYEWSSDRLPYKWIEKMKASLKAICPTYNTNRMVYEYDKKFYQPAMKCSDTLCIDNMVGVKDMNRWIDHIRQNWHKLQIRKIEVSSTKDLIVGDEVEFKVHVFLDNVEPAHVSLEVYKGEIDTNGEIVKGIPIALNNYKSKDNKEWVFKGKVLLDRSGLSGFTARLIPNDPRLCNPFDLRLITWAR